MFRFGTVPPDIAVATSSLVAVYDLSEPKSFPMRADDRIAAVLAPRDMGWRSSVTTIAAAAALFAGPSSVMSILSLTVLGLTLLVLLEGSSRWFALGGRPASAAPAPFDRDSLPRLRSSVWLASTGTAFARYADIASVGRSPGPTAATVYFVGVGASQTLQLLRISLSAVLSPQAARAALETGRDGRSAVIAVDNRVVFLAAVASTLRSWLYR